jgi:hypothetical protein
MGTEVHLRCILRARPRLVAIDEHIPSLRMNLLIPVAGSRPLDETDGADEMMDVTKERQPSLIIHHQHLIRILQSGSGPRGVVETAGKAVASCLCFSSHVFLSHSGGRIILWRFCKTLARRGPGPTGIIDECV